MGIRHDFLETRYEALDAIGRAFKKRRINFEVATELRDLARAGRITEVRDNLRRYQRQS